MIAAIVGCLPGAVWPGHAAEGTNSAKPAAVGAAGDRTVAELHSFLTLCFRRWDSDHDGSLTLSEVNAKLTDPKIVGNEAAAAVAVRNSLENAKDGKTNSLTLKQLLAHGEEPGWRAGFFRVRDRMWSNNRTVGRTLFMAGDPSLLSFHQGRIGDCYFLALVGGLVNRGPAAVHSMIRRSGSGYTVRFGGGPEVAVPALTDGEMIAGASAGREHGVWLCALEKAYSIRCREALESKSGAPIDPNATVTDLIGAPVHRDSYQGALIHKAAVEPIALLTGHRAVFLTLSRSDVDGSPTGLHEVEPVLVRMAREHRLGEVLTGPNGMEPDGIPTAHAFGVLGYDASAQSVTVFNPWGNDFTPIGLAGFRNGYPTSHGVFQVPLGDFVRIFTLLVYEAGEGMNDP